MKESRYFSISKYIIPFYSKMDMADLSEEKEQLVSVRIPARDERKQYHIMKFNGSLNIDFSQWDEARMVREDNRKIVNSTQSQDDDPKFGAGSVFGKAAKEEARLKKLGINKKEYDPEAQPWMLRAGGKKGKKYKGVKQGGVSDNTTFYVFIKGQDGSLEAYPVKNWYNFTPIMTYKALDAEEAEEKFSQREKILNKWSVMVHEKLKSDQDDAELDDEKGDKNRGKAGRKEFKISDMDDWDGSDDGLDTDEEEKKTKADSDDEGKRKKKGKDTKKKQKHHEVKNEAFDDSEDDDRQDREVDYMSDESSDGESSEEENANAKGVDMDGGLSKMLDSDESSEDEDKGNDKDIENEAVDKDETGKKNKGSGGVRVNSDEGKVGKGEKEKTNNSMDLKETDKANKRKALVANILDPNNQPNKKSRMEQLRVAGKFENVAGNEIISEEAVRKYLKRRPMTVMDLLKKFQSKKIGIHYNQLSSLMGKILDKINPTRKKVKNVIYYSMVGGG